MRDLIRGSLRRSLRDLQPMDRLAAAWPVACGSVLAARGEVEGLDEDGVLHIAVHAAEWMQPFLSVRAALAMDLARISGVAVSEIHFKAKPYAQVQSTTAWEKR